jgi:hypothetical protein
MLTKTIEQFLDKKKWKYTKLKDSNVFLFGITGKNGMFQSIIDLGENENEFALYSICSDRAKRENYGKVLEILNQLNYNLFLGNWELDTKDGEIRFRTTMFLHGFNPSESFIEQFILTHLSTVDSQLQRVYVGILLGMSSGIEKSKSKSK